MQSSSSLNGPGAGWPWDTKYRDPRIRGRLTLNSGIARWVAEVIDASLNLDNAGQRKPPDPRHSWVLQARVFSLHLLSFTCRQLSSFFSLSSLALVIIGSLRNDDDDDGNESGKKVKGLDRQNNNFARASRFFVHFSAVVARPQRETA